MEQKEKFQYRYEQALTPCHFIAFKMGPSTQEYPLTADKKYLVLETINTVYVNSGLLPLLIKFNVLCPSKTFFSEEITKNVSGIQW